MNKRLTAKKCAGIGDGLHACYIGHNPFKPCPKWKPIQVPAGNGAVKR